MKLVTRPCSLLATALFLGLICPPAPANESAQANRPEAARTQPARRQVVAVLPVSAGSGVPQALPSALTDLLSTEVFKTGRWTMANRAEIERALAEQKIQKSDICDSTKCIAEVGGAIGAEKLVVGSIRLVGSTYVLTVKLLDVTEIREDFADTETCICAADEVLNLVETLVSRMIADVAASPLTGGTTNPGRGPGSLAESTPVGGGDQRRSLIDPPRSAIPLTATDLGFAWPAGGDALGADRAPMVLVSAGEFLMGSAESETSSPEDEKPQHRVYLDAFYIDKYEVTNGQYRVFLESVEERGHERCDREEPSAKNHTPRSVWPDNGDTWNDSSWNSPQQPVVGVDWYDANAYCAWAGKRLPTEAEWEKAARGTDGRRYPWGSERPGASPQGNFADEAVKRQNHRWTSTGKFVKRYDDGFVFTAPVGRFPAGASPCGAQDMVGNVCEWVRDRYDQGYYRLSPTSNPEGPTSGDLRVIRGGSWFDGPERLGSVYRFRFAPTLRSKDVGFRCASHQENP